MKRLEITSTTMNAADPDSLASDFDQWSYGIDTRFVMTDDAI